jgi:hypothetical protein
MLSRNSPNNHDALAARRDQEKHLSTLLGEINHTIIDRTLDIRGPLSASPCGGDDTQRRP